MTLKEAEEKYGTIQGCIDRLYELLRLDDARLDDYQCTLRDINFTLGEADQPLWNMVDLAERLV